MSRALIGTLLTLLLGAACHPSTSDGAGAPGVAAPDDGDRSAEAGSSARAPAAEHAAASGRPPGPPEGGAGVDELKRLEGVSVAALVGELGEPTRRREFTMGECCTEFQIELLNTYPPKSGHEAVAIREWTWVYEGYALTAWLHEVEGGWRVLDTCRYSDDVEF